MSHPIIQLLWVLILGLTALSGNSQDSIDPYFLNQNGDTLEITNWSPHAVHVDSLGVAWYATSSGLVKYDGHQIKQYRTGRPSAFTLPNESLTAVCEDYANILWLGSATEGVIRFNPKNGTFTELKDIMKSSEYELTQINAIIHLDSTLYISAPFQGFFEYHIPSKSLSKQGLVNPVHGSNIVPNKLEILPDGKIALISYNGIVIKENNKYSPVFPIPNVDVYSGSFVSASQLLLCKYASDELYLFDIEQWSIHEVFTKLSSTIFNIQNVGNDKILFATGSGIYSWTGTSISIDASLPLSYEGLPSHSVAAIHKGCGEKTHFLTNHKGGGYFIPKTEVFQWRYKGDVRNFQFAGDDLLIADKGGIFRLKGSDKDPLYMARPNRNIHTFLPLDEDLYLINNQIKNSYSSFTSFWSKKRNKIVDEYRSRLFFYLSQLSNGDIVVDSRLVDSIQNYRIAFGGQIVEQIKDETYPDYSVNHFLELENGNILLASFKDGVFEINKERSEVFQWEYEDMNKGHLNSNNVHLLLEHTDGRLFIATDKGVNIIMPQRTETQYLDSSNGLQFSQILGMQEDEAENVWLFHNEQIVRVGRDGSVVKIPLPKEFKINLREVRMKLALFEGQIYFLCKEGIGYFDPDTLADFSKPEKPLVLSAFSKDHTFDVVSRDLAIPYNQRDIDIYIGAPLETDRNIKYTHYLEGYDDDWQISETDRTIDYTNLQPGKYSLSLKATNLQGEERLHLNALSFTIIPPWYRTWAMIILYWIIAATIIYALYKWRMKRMLRYQELRAQIAGNLHDSVGTYLAGMNMMAELISTKVPEELRSNVLEIKNIGDRAINRIQDLSWASDPTKDNIDALIQYLNEQAAIYEGNNRASIRIENKTRTLSQTINPLQRQYLIFIFQEYLQYFESKGEKEIRVTLNKMDRHIVLSLVAQHPYNDIEQYKSTTLLKAIRDSHAQVKIHNNGVSQILIELPDNQSV